MSLRSCLHEYILKTHHITKTDRARREGLKQNSSQIMKDFNLELQPGKTHALVGPSGCGKSTAVSILERFYDVIEGEVGFSLSWKLLLCCTCR